MNKSGEFINYLSYKAKQFLSQNLSILGDFISCILYIYCYLNKLSIVVIRENRYGHQIGTLDCELFLANERKKNLNIDTIFLLVETNKDVASKYLRQITPNIIQDFGFRCKVFASESKLTILQRLFKNYIAENKRFYRSSKCFTPHLSKSLFNQKYTSELILKQLKIEKKKYICIYSRDSKYLSQRFPDQDWSYHNHRNGDINNLKDLSNFVTEELNIEVVRIGSNVQNAINWTKQSFPKIIDYSSSNFVNDKNDIDLINFCSIYISNGGGPETVAIAARKEMIRINQTPILEEVGYEFGIYLPMLIRRNIDKSIVSIREVINLGLARTYSYHDYRKVNLTPEENDRVDILNAFKDYLKYKKNDFNHIEREIISKYKIIRKENEKKGLMLKGFNNFIAPSFLLKYPQLLD